MQICGTKAVTLVGASEFRKKDLLDCLDFAPTLIAVDGGASANNFRSQVGDSFIITKDGYEQITHHSKKIEDLIISNG